MPTITIRGKTLGTCVINEFLILFTHESGVDRIYKVNRPNSVTGISNITKLVEENLSFVDDENHLIQTLPFYENESIQKVYWIDGLNQPRVINIAIDDGRIFNYTNTSFNFIQNLGLNETATIEKLYNTGIFKSGVIQYAATYFNKNGAESNIFWISDINYISNDDRAGKSDEIIQNAFKISLSNLESKFDYIRIYSIYRTSLDSTPEVKNIVDLKIPTTKTIMYVDGGTSGSIITSDFLLYVGGEELIPQCMSQKNNTLFLGNISLPDNVIIPPTLQTNGDVISAGIPIHNSTFEWETNDIDFEGVSSPTGNPMYPYLPFKSNIKHFKFDETYRLGIQGQFDNGKWSNPIWLGYDNKVDKRYSTKYDTNGRVELTYITGKYSVDNIIRDYFNDTLGFLNVRPVMVPLNYSDRTIIAQGIVNNTLGIMKNRFGANKSSLPFSYPDYSFRTNGKAKITYLNSNAYDGQYSHFDLLKLNNNLKPDSNNPDKWIENMGNGDTWDYHDISHNGTPPIGSPHTEPFGGDFNRDFFFVDRNIVNFWSPDLINNTETLNSYVKNVTSVGLYGFAFQTALSSKFEIDFGDISNSPESDPLNNNISNYYSGNDYIGLNDSKRLFPLLKGVKTNPDTQSDWRRTSYHNIPIWSPKDYINELPSRDEGWSADITTVNFTKLNKSGYNYFGLNRTLNTSFTSYKYNINKPYLVFNDSTIFYESNSVDNTSNNGNILYSKFVEKNYPSNAYFNTIRFSDPTRTHHPELQYEDIIGWGSVHEKNPVNSGLSVKYNTNTHALFSFGVNGGSYSCMPRLQNYSESITGEDISNPTNSGWYRNNTTGFKVDVINRNNLNDIMLSSDRTSQNTLPIFDLYSNVIGDTRYGGQSSDALYNNTWIPCGDVVKLTTSPLILKYTSGDTYINRFDMLRVFPNDILQIPQHTEIVSFICESFTNSDGRDDVNRYNTDSSLMTIGNYGLFNNVYSQKNNYFTYNILDPLLFNTKNYTNSIVWSKIKVSGESIDTWTHMNMLSSIDLEGVNGEVSSINLFNNNLYVFQNTAIAQLLYNERVQQQVSDGTSLELVNGYRVPDYRYMTNQRGSNNKWSIVEGEASLYYIDYVNKSLSTIGMGMYGHEFKDLSSELGFKSWFNNNISTNPYILSYDKINNDLYIHNDTLCLNYSEILHSFASFYDYIDTLRMQNVWSEFISIKSDEEKTDIWINNKGDYNMFYGEQQPFSIEYLLNPEPLNDKVFNTFEYRLNSQLIDWNNVSVSNWYQNGTINNNQYLSNMKRKFNVNRVQFPRQSKTLDSNGDILENTLSSLNRIRSTWARMKLSHEKTTVNVNKKFDMQDLNITYTI